MATHTLATKAAKAKRLVKVVDIAERLGLSATLGLSLYKKWTQLRVNASRRKVACSLTYSGYCKLAIKSDVTRASQIGTRSNSLQLGRLGDTGPYSYTNCRFITAAQNRAESVANGGQERGASKRRGLSKYTDSGFAKLSKIHARWFYATSPTGKSLLGSNLVEFCRTHKFNKGGVCAVARGNGKLYKGWNFSYVTEDQVSSLKRKVVVWQPKNI